MRERSKTERKFVHFSVKSLSLIIISSFFMLIGCIKEEVNTDLPKPGTEQIQLHNFNAPISGGSLDGSAPDMFYFRQKEDGSYVFMLTSTNTEGFETDWKTEYVLVTTNAMGVILKTEGMKFPVTDGVIRNFDYVFDAGTPPPESPLASDSYWFDTFANGPNYVSDDKGMLYYTPDLNCYCRNLFFKLDPETGQAEYFSTGPDRPKAQIFQTSDGGFITIGGAGAPDYNKFSASGTLEFKQPMRYWEAQPTYVYLTGRNGDQYFITTYHGPSEQRFIENTAKAFFYYSGLFYFNFPNIDFEVRFGPGQTQKAHRFNRGFCFCTTDGFYEDYVDVPFEVWDLTHNQQLMVIFRDQGLDGKFNLVPMKVDDCVGCGGSDYLRTDPTQSQEWITVIDLPYSTTPDENIIHYGGFSQSFVNISNYLTPGATWNETALPPSSFSIKIGPRPGTQLLKVNAEGSTVVKDNYTLGTVPLENMFKAVPYLDGSAVLINVTSRSVANPATQLVILDADFNQNAVLNMTFNTADREHQLEYNKAKDRIFYARITKNPDVNLDNTYKGSLLLTLIQDNSIKHQKYLDKFIPFKLEKYRMTPTKTGGVAIVAWVRPTKDTRDLLFFELDENLELVKR